MNGVELQAPVSWLVLFTRLDKVQRRSTGATYRTGSYPPWCPVRLDPYDSLSHARAVRSTRSWQLHPQETAPCTPLSPRTPSTSLNGCAASLHTSWQGYSPHHPTATAEHIHAHAHGDSHTCTPPARQIDNGRGQQTCTQPAPRLNSDVPQLATCTPSRLLPTSTWRRRFYSCPCSNEVGVHGLPFLQSLKFFTISLFKNSSLQCVCVLDNGKMTTGLWYPRDYGQLL
jgi:hypothetical protein